MSRLLLLEDDVSLIDGLKYSLEKNGFELDVVHTVRRHVYSYIANILMISFC